MVRNSGLFCILITMVSYFTSTARALFLFGNYMCIIDNKFVACTHIHAYIQCTIHTDIFPNSCLYKIKRTTRTIRLKISLYRGVGTNRKLCKGGSFFEGTWKWGGFVSGLKIWQTLKKLFDFKHNILIYWKLLVSMLQTQLFLIFCTRKWGGEAKAYLVPSPLLKVGICTPLSHPWILLFIVYMYFDMNI